MKKFLSIILSICIIFTIFTMPATALVVEPAVENVEQLSVSAALADPEILNFLIENDELNELYKAQEEIRNFQYDITAAYTRESLGNFNISANDVQNVSEKYNLQLPSETVSKVIDNGTINIQRNSLGKIIDVWYIYYTVTSKSFSVRAALVDADNPLDLVSGTITRYYLNNSTWKTKDSKPFKKAIVTKGTVYTWTVPKWGVKEKFEYNTTVSDNGLKHNYNNVNEDNFVRYNFEAKPYKSFSANGGQRHHFVPATSLRSNDYDSNTAYCIRMMTEDHKKTGSYGSSKYVAEMTNLLSDQKYEDALQKEVDDLKSKYDCEGIAGNLQQKYFDEVVTCLIKYESLFEIN